MLNTELGQIVKTTGGAAGGRYAVPVEQAPGTEAAPALSQLQDVGNAAHATRLT